MSKEELEQRLEECNARILNIKSHIKHFRNYRKWWKVINWNMYNKQEIEDWVNKYKSDSFRSLGFHMTLEQIAKVMKITRERVGMIERRALEKLRHPEEFKILYTRRLD